MIIPYDKDELRIALIMMEDKIISDDTKEKLEEISVEMNAYISSKDKKELNEKIAVYHGISVSELIASVNYGILCSEYHENTVKQYINKIVEKFDITEKEAWAIFTVIGGLLD